MDPTFSPTDFIIPPPEEAWVERRPDGDLVIHRQPASRLVAVRVSDNPDDFTAGHPLPVAPPGPQQVVTPATLAATVGDARPYFLLEGDGRRLVVAERALPLAGGVNFRDVGGYRTTDGRAVRWGAVYRSGSLSELHDDAVARLGRLGLRLSYDLRSTEETLLRPDRLPPGAAALHHPIVSERSYLHWMVALFRLRHRMQEFLLNVYKGMLDQNGPVFAEFVRRAAGAENLPLVVHCTAGKDRTGLATALLLLALGVPEETVVADYTLSNNAFDILAETMKPELVPLYAFGLDDAQLQPFLLAEARTLAAALAHLRRRHGSVEAYLRQAGLEDGAIERARRTLLTG